jgi:mono/diheme cytochrome c family protein
MACEETPFGRVTAPSVLTIVLVLAAGCNVGSITMEMGDPIEPDSGAVASDAGPPDSKAFFDREVMPLLDVQCVACHAPGRTGPAFIVADPDVYSSVLDWPALVNLRDPGSSRLLTKGEHSGPAWNGDQAATVRAWLDLEASASTGEEDEEVEHRTPAIEVAPGFNMIPLEDLGLPGSSITFSAERVGDGVFLADFEVTAGPGGVHLMHPVVIAWVGGAPLPDSVDRLAGVEITVAPYGTAPIGGGTFVLVDFPEGALLSLMFDDAGPSVGGGGADGGVDADGGVPTTGCSNAAGFTSNAQPQFATYCVRCHGGGDPMAASAVDMSPMTDMAPEAQQRSCDEILTRINRADPASSPLFRQPDPASGTLHPFKFGTSGEVDSFRSSVLLWLATED